MTDGDDDDFVAGEWQELPDGFPTLDTEEERNTWAQILLAQDVEEQGAKCVLVKDEHGRMIIRVQYRDGTDDLYDVQIARSIERHVPEQSEMN